MRAVQVLGPSTGGIRVHVATLAANLSAMGLEAPVLGPQRVLDGLGPQDGVVTVPSGMSPPGLMRARRELRPWLLSADVVHAHGLKAGWTCARRGNACPLVLTVHNVVLDEAAGRSAGLRRRLERAVLRSADRVIAPTEAIAHGLDGIVGAERIRVIVPASPRPVPHRSRADIRARMDISDDTPLVVCVARLHPQKDIPTLLRAWRQAHAAVPAARLAVIGEGPDRGGLEALSGELGLDNSVDLIGFDAHAVDWIAAADVAAISSVWEAIPLVLAEAMQLGIPVVSTDVGLAFELLGDGVAGDVVHVGDAEALGASLVRFLVDPQIRRAAGEAASERSAGRFDPQALSAAVLDVYEELVADGGRAA